MSEKGGTMRALVLCDDYWHPAHTPRAGLAPLANAGFGFDWIVDAREWSAARMADYPVVILAKSNDISAADRTEWMTSETEEAFRAFVRDGGGLLAIHSGTAGYRETPILRAFLGGVFLQHPPQCEVTIAPHGEGALTAGLAPFTIRDEHYQMAFEAADATLFLDTVSEHGTQPGGWTREEGAGRVGVLTPGHNVEVWLHPTYQALLGNALRWCGGLKQD